MASAARNKKKRTRSGPAGEARQAPAAGSRPPAWAFALVLLVLPFLLYAPALEGPFVLDDYDLMESQSAVRLGTFQALRQTGRPVLMFTYHLNYRLAGFDPFWFHLTNVLLHGVNAVLVWLLFGLLFRGGWLDRWIRPGWRPLVHYGVPLLFLASPVQTEAVAYISSRSEVLAATWYLAALCVFASPLRERRRWLTAFLVSGLFVLAALTKQDKLTLPFAIVLLDYLLIAGCDWRKLRDNWPTYAIFSAGLVAGFFLVVVPFLNTPSAGFGLNWQRYLFTQFRVWFEYFKLLAVPVGLNVDPYIQPSPTLTARLAWLALLGLLAIGGAVAWIHRRRPVAAFGALFFAVTLAPSSSIYPLLDFIAERRLYLPSIGFYLVAVLGLLALLGSRKALAAAALAAAVGAYSIGAYQRSQVWADELALWTDAVEKAPEKWRPWNWLGRVYSERGQQVKAIQAWEKAAERVPKKSFQHTYILGNLGLAYANLKQYDKALEYYQKALEISPGESRLWAQAAVAQMRLGRDEEGWRSFERAFKTRRPTAELFLLRGQEHYQAGRYQEAAEDFREALRLRPENQQARKNLAAAEEMLRRQAPSGGSSP